MLRLHVAYNFGCSALYNLPWRASVSSHIRFDVTFLPFEALSWKNMCLFLEKRRKFNKVWLHAMMQSDCLLSLFFEIYNPILLCV